MSYDFTKEGIQLATFKLAMDNNALLKCILNVLARQNMDAPNSEYPETEELQTMYEEGVRNFYEASLIIKDAHSNLALIDAHSFATDHDSNLDDDDNGIFHIKEQ